MVKKILIGVISSFCFISNLNTTIAQEIQGNLYQNYADKPIIYNIQTTATQYGYLITASIDSARGITRIAFPTWTTKNDQDDVKWYDGTIVGDNVRFEMHVKDHNYENGEYNTHIYFFKGDEIIGISGIEPQNVQKAPSEIYNVRITNRNATGYTVEADLKSDYGFDRIAFPTWTTKNGQDDVKWYDGQIKGNHVSFRVDVKDHNYEDGEYNTHIYGYDKSGKVTFSCITPEIVKKTQFEITNVQITELNATGYTVEADLKSDYGVSRVAFPTWTTKNDQDDVKWYDGKILGSHVTFHVSIKDHNNEFGEYNTHIYAYDKAGRTVMTVIDPITVKETDSEIYNVRVTERNATGYTIEADLKSDYGFSRVAFPTWTTKNGQDDIKWYDGQIIGNHVTFRVNVKDHNYEDGEYHTHIHGYDKNGKVIFSQITPEIVKKTQPEIYNVQITNRNATGYTIEADLKSDYGFSKITFPTWTEKNGQDDLKWHDGQIIGNHVTLRVDVKNHNYEDGLYTTHIYGYDNAGQLVTHTLESVNIENLAPIISNVKIIDITSWGYTVTAEINDDLGIERIAFPTWTEKNGQDDIKWYNGQLIGNRVTFRVDVKDHNYEDGEYNTHIYAYDKGGKLSVECLRMHVEIKANSGWTYRNGRKLLFNRDGKIVTGAKQLIIDVSEHNGIINWEKVKASGVDGVILRCGYGWNDNTNDQKDIMFEKNAKELERLGIPYGVYLFSYGRNVYDAEKEAEYTLKLIKGRKITLPVYYDLEYSSYVGDLSAVTYTNMAHAYCKKIEKSGYAAGIYANLNYWNTKLSDSSLDRYTKWIAQYNTNDGQAGHCDYTKPYDLWQYTSVGKVNGINGNVDMNAAFF